MMNTAKNHGKVVPGVKAFNWYGRPLLLSNRTRDLTRAQLTKVIDAELARGCDGFVFRINTLSTKSSFAKQTALLEELLDAYSQVAFIYLEVIADTIERSLLEILSRRVLPQGFAIASRNPNVLVELWRLDPNLKASFAIIVDTERGFSKLGCCPYTTVEILDVLATHVQFWGVHSSLKEVFVRALFRERKGAFDQKEVKKIEKRINWLIHEKVDAIITNRSDLVSHILGVGSVVGESMEML